MQIINSFEWDDTILSPWSGGARPVSPLDLVIIKLRNGDMKRQKAGDLSWEHCGGGGDIIAYRIA